MAEMKFNLKGPLGVLVAILVIGGFIFFKLYRRKRSKNLYERITDVTQIS